jgi:hypothetical protein
LRNEAWLFAGSGFRRICNPSKEGCTCKSIVPLWPLLPCQLYLPSRWTRLHRAVPSCFRFPDREKHTAACMIGSFSET